MVNKYLVGFLTIVLLLASVYIVLPNKVRIDVGNTYTTIKVWENNSWVLGGTERTILMDGTKKMRAKSRNVESFIVGNVTTIIRTANFKDNITAIDTYIFDGNTKSVILFPISHEVNIINGEGKIFLYEVKNLEYRGETMNDVHPPMHFGHQMKIEWEDNNYYSKIFKYKGKDEGKLSVRYRINSSDFTRQVRLFDPPIEGNDLIVNNGETVTLGGFNDTYDVVWVKSGGTLNINSTIGNLTLVANNITIDGTVNAIDIYNGGSGKVCTGSSSEINGDSGSGLTPGGGGQGLESSFYDHGLGGGGAGNARIHTQFYTPSCDGYNYYIGEGGGYCGAFNIFRNGGAAGNIAASTQSDYNITAGSGGGGGGCSNGVATSAVGGKGAGLIIFNAPIINIQGTINLQGSNGGSASGSSGYAGGGGAGSGGSLGIFGKLVDISSSTINVNPGIGGTGYGSKGTTGGAGSGGRIKVFYKTLDSTSLTTNLGAYGTYFAEEIAYPTTSMISDDSNFTTEAIAVSCNNTLNSYGSNTYDWKLYKNDVLNLSGTTASVSGYINVANLSADTFVHDDVLKLECVLGYGEINLTDTLELEIHQPIWIDITSPLNGASVSTSSLTVLYNYENWTNYDSCWYNNDTGVNISIPCDGVIPPRIYDDGLHNITIYGNSTDGIYEYSDFVEFTIVSTVPYIACVDPTPENGTWLSVDYIYVKTEILPCLTYKNSTYYIRSVEIYE